MAHKVLSVVLSVVVVFAALIFMVPEAQAAILTESFEGFTPPEQPTTSEDYTFASSNVNVGVSANRAHNGNQSLRFRPTSSASIAGFELTGFDACSETVTFWLNYEAIDDAFTVGLGTASSPADATVNRYTQTGGNHRFNAVDIAAVELDTWVDITLYRIVTAGGGVAPASPCDASYTAQDCISSVTLEYAACTTASAKTLQGPLDSLTFTSVDSGPFPLDVFIDDLTWDAGDITTVTPNGPEIVVVDLVGGDVDKSGTTMILRTKDAAGGTEDNVRTYAAGSLASAGGPEDTDCNRIGGVAAMRTNVAFLECNDGVPDDVDFVKVRDANLGPPDLPAFCYNFCTGDIDANELAGDQSAVVEIAAVEEMPFTFNDARHGSSSQAVGGADFVAMAFGMSFTDGYVGVATYIFNGPRSGPDLFDDKSQIQRISVGPTGTVADQICTVQDGDGQSYLYSAHEDAQAKGFSVDFTLDNDDAEGTSTFAVNLVETFSGSAITASPLGVACGEERFAVITATTLSIWNRGASSPVCTRTVASVPSAGLAMSGDGDWVAWVEGTTMRVASVEASPANAFRDAVPACGAVAQATIPTGDFVFIDTDGNAQQVWVGTDVRVRNYNAVYQLTTGNATACNPGDVGCGGGGTTTTTAGAGGGGLIGGALGATGSVLAALGTVILFVTVAFLTTRPKKGDDE